MNIGGHIRGLVGRLQRPALVLQEIGKKFGKEFDSAPLALGAEGQKDGREHHEGRVGGPSVVVLGHVSLRLRVQAAGTASPSCRGAAVAAPFTKRPRSALS